MSLYLDASALVKRYVEEEGSEEVAHAVHDDPLVCTSVVTRAETSAALARAVRAKILDADDAVQAREALRGEWSRLARVQVTEAVVARADEVAWSYRLRGYDAVQLASALWWRDAVDPDVAFAAFDVRLRRAATAEGLVTLPGRLRPAASRTSSPRTAPR